ncbi:MAG: hypothetical protein FWF05_04690 [Oscillospiraceae bacterium]|nr:hypothetical protein [Oscillospiraceae bacterium]
MSKRNHVELCGGVVRKRVQSPEAAVREAAILRELRGRGVAVPHVLDLRGCVLTLEYLPGEPLPDLIESGGFDPGKLAFAVCGWFAAFYEAVPPGEIRGDVNGRNFLYDGAKIYGVDFERRVYGTKARDAGRLAAFFATYDTCDPARRAALRDMFIKEFCERFECAAEDVQAEFDAERTAMRVRRKSNN